MLLYMIRHGQSESNLGHFHGGWAQVNLTPKGKEDARKAGEAIKGIFFDKVYSSDLVRALQTREIALPDREPTVTELLREINVGDLSWKYVEDCKKLYGEEYDLARAKRDFTAFNGESTEDQMNRARDFLKLLEVDPCDKVAAFCHEGTIRCVLTIVMGAKELDKRLCKNGGVSIFEFSEGKWSLVQWDI